MQYCEVEWMTLTAFFMIANGVLLLLCAWYINRQQRKIWELELRLLTTSLEKPKGRFDKT
jgi:hypothetical protein